MSRISVERSIRRGLPIELGGLTYYPITMVQYDEFIKCSEALALRISSLPARFAMKDFLNAIFTYEQNEIANERPIMGLFQRVLLLWFMALRIDMNLGDFMRENMLVKKVGEFYEIDSLLVRQADTEVSVTAIDFTLDIRSLIAKQNGIELPNESDNVELVEAAEELAEIKNRNAKKLNFNIDDLVASVAYCSRCRESEVYEWTIREFQLRRKAIDRLLKYQLYGQADMSGMVTFKNGNPFPCWFADVVDDTCGTISASQLGSQLNH